MPAALDIEFHFPQTSLHLFGKGSYQIFGTIPDGETSADVPVSLLGPEDMVVPMSVGQNSVTRRVTEDPAGRSTTNLRFKTETGAAPSGGLKFRALVVPQVT